MKELDPIEKELIEQKANSRIKHSKLLGAGNCGAVWKILFEDGTLVCYKKDNNSDRLEKEGEKYAKMYKEREGIELIGEKIDSQIDSQGVFIPYLGKTISWKIILSMPDWAKVCLCYGLTQALASAHKHNILYRDLKQDNFVIDDEGEALLIDFGRSEYITEDTSLFKDWKGVLYPVRAVQLMMQEQVPPDYYWIKGKVGFWSDIYSLGVLFKKILYGVPGAGILYQSCLSRNPEERPTLDKISNYLINPLLENGLNKWRMRRDVFNPLSFFNSLTSTPSIEEQSFDQEASSRIQEELRSKIKEAERDALFALEGKLFRYYESLKVKYWKDDKKKFKNVLFHTGGYCSKLCLAGDSLRLIQKCRREERWDLIIETLFSVQEDFKKSLEKWGSSSRYRRIHEIIELCNQGISILISKNVCNNDLAFGDHSVNKHSWVSEDPDPYKSNSSEEFNEPSFESNLST